MAAGYIIDLESRTLVETIGTEVAGVMSDYPRTGVHRRSQRAEPGSIRKERPALENGRDRFGRISKHSGDGHQLYRRSAGGIEVGTFPVDLASGEVSFANAGAAPKSVE